MFVSFWTDKVLKFGNHTTNRVESQHSNLKLHLDSPHSNLDRFVSIIDQVVKLQYTSIKESIEKSRIFVNPMQNTHMFQALLGFISKDAIDLISAELERSNGLDNCDCILRTSCGLPCACELAKIFNEGQYISIDSIDIFWRKLDLQSCTSLQDDDLTCDVELEKVKQTFQKQSKFGKASIIRRIKGLYDATKTFVLEPVVQNTPGRQSLKNKQQKNSRVKPSIFVPPTQEPPRYSYSNMTNFVGSDSFDLNHSPRRYSSYMDPKPSMYSTYMDPEPPRYSSYMDPEPSRSSFYMNPEPPRYLDPLVKEIPDIFQHYIRQIHNVKGDGNCGFRAVAVCLGLHENDWPRIRSDLLNEIIAHQQVYSEMFGGSVWLNKLFNSINFSRLENAPFAHWMVMPDTGALIASCYNMIVHFISNDGCSTWLPLWSSPPENPQNVTCVIALVHHNHYVKVDLQGDYPLSLIYPSWYPYKRDCAAGWETLYLNRH